MVRRRDGEPSRLRGYRCGAPRQVGAGGGDRFGVAPEDHTLRREFVDAVRGAIEDQLSKHQRQVFVAIVIDWLPARPWQSPLVQTATPSTRRCTSARRTLRAALVAKGYLDPAPGGGDEVVSRGRSSERLVRTRPVPPNGPTGCGLRRDSQDPPHLRGTGSGGRVGAGGGEAVPGGGGSSARLWSLFRRFRRAAGSGADRG